VRAQARYPSFPRSRGGSPLIAARDRRDDGGDRPQERLFRHGAEVLSDAELLALLLRTGAPGERALDAAASLLRSRGGLPGLARSVAPELLRARGIGPAKAASLLAAFELSRRIAGRRLRAGTTFRDPSDVFAHFHPQLRDAPQERFAIVLLDGRHRVLREEVISLGTLTASLVHPREVFRPALRDCAAGLILVHNHPSGDPTPSAEDREVTERLAAAGELLGVCVLDHVIVAERGYCSLREEGLLIGRRT
jgi:DNA repair protein RadC